MSEPHIGVYPGTFDPITNGHMDIITRATTVVHRLIVAVADSDSKGPMFPLDERVQMIRAELDSLPGGMGKKMEVRSFDTLLMNFVGEVGATVIIRGLRAVSDFEYEFQMAGMNARLNADVETVFLMAAERQQFISSRFVKEIARLGGDISSFVSGPVAAKVAAQLGRERR